MARRKTPTPGAISEYQKFEIATVSRQYIQRAPYNPRTLSPENEKLLRQSLKRNGLVEPLVWNRRSGNLVGGHQRLQQLDALEKREDYSLTVAVVDVDEAQEKILNLALNNRNIQGDWEEEQLGDLIRALSEDDFAAVGLTESDVDYYRNDDSALKALIADSEERAETKDKLADIKQDREAMNAKLAEQQRADFFCVVLFESQTAKQEFYTRFGLNMADGYLRAEQILGQVE